MEKKNKRVRITGKSLRLIVKLLNKAFYLIGLIVFILTIIAFGLGFLGGWFSKKSNLQNFPLISKEDKILVLAPHPDDETLGTGGLIRIALEKGADVKVVVATDGDNNEGYLFHKSIQQDLTPQNLKFNPQNFVELGIKRQNESTAAMQILGLKTANLIFLGYPDSGLSAMFSENYTKPFSSPSTRLTYSPYYNTYKSNSEYKGENLDRDLKEIITDFKPTMIFVTHIRDIHPDHHTLALFLHKALVELKYNTKVYYYIIHYKNFPLPNDKAENQLIYPPGKLFSYEGWYSLSLTKDEENKKDEALSKYKSQIVPFLTEDKMYSFVRRNEIFEAIK